MASVSHVCTTVSAEGQHVTFVLPLATPCGPSCRCRAVGEEGGGSGHAWVERRYLDAVNAISKRTRDVRVIGQRADDRHVSHVVAAEAVHHVELERG